MFYLPSRLIIHLPQL
uniref:Uncharacterized protein n=1 Tax=Anguilla anguilla TaxID=7936 RepID=A0A0E9PKF5_ANGAN